MRGRLGRFAVSGLIIGVLSFVGIGAWQLTSGEPASASVLTQQAQEHKSQILAEIRRGGVFYMKSESYSKDRLTPRSLPQAFHFPDRVIEETWITADSTGTIISHNGAIHDTSGNLLAMVKHGEQGKQYTAADTGEQWVLRAPRLRGNVTSWAESQFGKVTSLEEQGWKVVDQGEYQGRSSVMLERQSRRRANSRETADGSAHTDVREEAQVVEGNPLLVRYRLFKRVDDGEWYLFHEQKRLEVKILPPGSPMGPTPK